MQLAQYNRRQDASLTVTKKYNPSYTSAIISTSTKAPNGRSFTATQERAGLEVKYLAYTSLNALKSAISAKKQVVLITSEKSEPAAANTASMFLHTCSVCSTMPPSTTVPVAGRFGRRPAPMLRQGFRCRRSLRVPKVSPYRFTVNPPAGRCPAICGRSL